MSLRDMKVEVEDISQLPRSWKFHSRKCIPPDFPADLTSEAAAEEVYNYSAASLCEH